MICKNCGRQSDGKFCPDCGQPADTHRITFSHLLHEVFHLFTHLDSGFLYTLKSLVKNPGTMQRLYLEGHRTKHQKPFSMFFICATALALAVYQFTKDVPSDTGIMEARNDFVRHYFVLSHVILLPFYALVTWLLFKHSHYNYTEILILIMYSASIMFLILVPINALNLLKIHFSTKPLEVIIISIYNIWTFRNFFKKTKQWLTIVLSIASIVINYMAFTLITDWIVENVMAKG